MATVETFAKKFGWEVLAMPEPEAEVTGGYAGDLLSWVMGRAEAGQLWVTIMTNLNIIAVASLSGVAGVVVTESAELSPEIVERAKAQGINLFRSAKDTFGTVLDVGTLLS